MSKIMKSIVLGASAAMLSSIAAPALASDAGAFIGGVAAARVAQNMRARTQAEQQQAYYAQQQAQSAPVQQAAPAAAPASQSPQARMKQLDALAAGGYITPAEYKQKKQAILDGM